MGKLKRRIHYLFFISLLSLGTAIGANIQHESSQEELKKMAASLKSLEGQLKNIEKDIGERQQNIVQTFEKKKALEKKIFGLESQLLSVQKKLQHLESNLNKRFKALVLVSFDNSESEDIYWKKILIDGLRKKKKLIESLKSQRAGLKSTFNKFNTEFNESKRVEDELLLIVRKLEGQKLKMAQDYVDQTELRDLFKSKSVRKSESVMAQSASSSDGESMFSLPISFEAKTTTHSEKGITYIFSNGGEVVAPRAGRIIYSGTLSNYGHVVMIDHGESIRSVLLGDFSPNVKKGQNVSTGQALGSTISLSAQNKVTGKIYFEVRKFNKAQNTKILMSRK